MKRMLNWSVLVLTASTFLFGCTQTAPPAKTSGAPDPKLAEAAKAKLLLASEPAGARSVIDVKKEAKDGGEVVVVGRIGGSKEPFTQGRASFLLADASFVPCTERAEPEESDTPWEFC